MFGSALCFVLMHELRSGIPAFLVAILASVLVFRMPYLWVLGPAMGTFLFHMMRPHAVGGRTAHLLTRGVSRATIVSVHMTTCCVTAVMLTGVLMAVAELSSAGINPFLLLFVVVALACGPALASLVRAFEDSVDHGPWGSGTASFNYAVAGEISLALALASGGAVATWPAANPLTILGILTAIALGMVALNFWRLDLRIIRDGEAREAEGEPRTGDAGSQR